jgi:hypothetical protein
MCGRPRLSSKRRRSRRAPLGKPLNGDHDHPVAIGCRATVSLWRFVNSFHVNSLMSARSVSAWRGWIRHRLPCGPGLASLRRDSTDLVGPSLRSLQAVFGLLVRCLTPPIALRSTRRVSCEQPEVDNDAHHSMAHRFAACHMDPVRCCVQQRARPPPNVGLHRRVLRAADAVLRGLRMDGRPDELRAEARGVYCQFWLRRAERFSLPRSVAAGRIVVRTAQRFVQSLCPCIHHVSGQRRCRDATGTGLLRLLAMCGTPRRGWHMPDLVHRCYKHRKQNKYVCGRDRRQRRRQPLHRRARWRRDRVRRVERRRAHPGFHLRQGLRVGLRFVDQGVQGSGSTRRGVRLERRLRGERVL